MPQINKGETFEDGQQVDGQRLNDLIDNATIEPEIITTQNPMAGSVANEDTLLLHDHSVSELRKVTVQELFSGNIQVTTDALTTNVVNAKTGKDLVVTPNDGSLVTGKAFTSIDGITAVVTSVAHGLENKACLDISASNALYSGQYFITVINVDSFSYTIRQETPVATSGTLDYTKKGSVKTVGSEHISGNLEIAGKVELKGATTFSGNTLFTGSSTSEGACTFKGATNFTGTLQVNGSTAYVLYSITSETIAPWSVPSTGFHNGVFSSIPFTKPEDEIWVLNLNVSINATGYPVEYAIRYGSQTFQTGQYLAFVRHKDSGGEGVQLMKHSEHNFLVPAGTELTSETIKIDAHTQNTPSGMQMFTTSGLAGTAFTSASLAPSTFRIYKYKTA
jgi:hypothetical protein